MHKTTTVSFTVSGSVGVGEAVVPSLLRTRYRREARAPDDEEEMWFNDDDELDDEPPLDAPPAAHTPHPAHSPHHAIDAIGNNSTLLYSTLFYSTLLYSTIYFIQNVK